MSPNIPGLDGALTWLRVDPPSTARFELRDRKRAAANGGGDLRGGLSRWRRALIRRRALVLLRRYALVAVVAALLAEIGIWAAGGERRTWWLLAPLVVALIGFAIAMSRRVTVAQTASMFDTGLGLRNRVATAVELAELEARIAEGPPGAKASATLTARVRSEASTAVADSFGTARLRLVGAPREWGALGAAVVALALLLALAPGATVAGGANAQAGVHGPGAAGTGGRNHHGHHGLLGAHVPEARTIPIPLALTKHSGEPVNPYVPNLTARQLKRDSIASAKHQGTRDFKRVHASSPHGVAGEPGLANSAQQTQSGRSQGLPSHLGSGGGGLGHPTKLPKGAAAPTAGGQNSPKGAPHSGRPSAAAKPGNAVSGSQQGGTPHAPVGGEQAGSAAGSQALGQGLTPELPHGSVGLPLQAGYAPSLAKHGSNGGRTSQTPNGNGHGGNTARAYSVSARQGTGFAVIPPSSDAAPAASRTQRDNYFGVANQLQLKHW